MVGGEGGDLVLPNLPDPTVGAGVLPTQIKKLVDSRRQVSRGIYYELIRYFGGTSGER